MNQLRLAVVPLRVLLVLFFLGLVVVQTLSFPGQFRAMAQEDPDSAHLRWPLTVWMFLLLACVQVVIFCTWKLLDLVRNDAIFREGAFRWVDTIIGAIAVAWMLFVGMGTYLVYLESDPGPAVMLTGISVAGAVFGLLVVVMRALLKQATALRTDMDAVI